MATGRQGAWVPRLAVVLAGALMIPAGLARAQTGTIAPGSTRTVSGSGNYNRNRNNYNTARNQRLQQQREQEQQRQRQIDQARKELERRRAQRRKAMEKLTLNMLKELFKKAKEAEKEEQWGAAYSHYHDVSLSRLKGAKTMVTESKQKLDEIEKRVDELLREARLNERRGAYASAAELYGRILGEFKFSPRAKLARQRLTQLARSPRSGSAILFTEAQVLEDAGDYARAKEAYERIIERYPEELAALRAEKRLEAFGKDPEIAAALDEGRKVLADEKCPRWLNLADNFIINKQPQRAKEYLERVIEEFPDSEWAGKARVKLASLTP